jgi:hypothetical protein
LRDQCKNDFKQGIFLLPLQLFSLRAEFNPTSAKFGNFDL